MDSIRFQNEKRALNTKKNSDMGRITTLLIDDDKLFLHLTEKLIKDESFIENIYTKSNITDAKQFLEACEAKEFQFPDLIFVDMNMPEMSGIEFAELFTQTYAKQHSQTKLIILTSSISRKDKTNAMEKPEIFDFLQKPLTKEMLINLVPLDKGE